MNQFSDDYIYNFWLHRDCMDSIRAGDMKAQFVNAVRAILAAASPVAVEEAVADIGSLQRYAPAMYGNPGEMEAHADGRYVLLDDVQDLNITTPAQTAAVQADTTRLDFMATEECRIESLTLASGTRYRLHWPLTEEAQREWSESPREAIDAYRAAMSSEGGANG